MNFSVDPQIYTYVCVCVCVFTNSFIWAGCDPRQIFKRTLAGFDSELSFSWIGCCTKGKWPSLPYYLPIAGWRIIGSISLFLILFWSYFLSLSLSLSLSLFLHTHTYIYVCVCVCVCVNVSFGSPFFMFIFLSFRAPVTSRGKISYPFSLMNAISTSMSLTELNFLITIFFYS